MVEETEKIYGPAVLEDAPFPDGQDPAVSVPTQDSSKTEQRYGAEKIKDRPLPIKRVATELLSSALNTKSKKILAEFSFTEMGALQIGKYENGVSGDLRITPNGITARNSAGNTTFSIDGATGNAVFAGQIQSGSLITGQVIVGDNRVIIDGEEGRILISDDDGVDRILIGFLEDGF